MDIKVNQLQQLTQMEAPKNRPVREMRIVQDSLPHGRKASTLQMPAVSALLFLPLRLKKSEHRPTFPPGKR